MEHNWTQIITDLPNWITQGYITSLGIFFYPILFGSIIGYIYLKNRSLTVGAGAVLIIISVFANALMQVPVFVNFLWIFVSLIFTVVVVLFIKRMVK